MKLKIQEIREMHFALQSFAAQPIEGVLGMKLAINYKAIETPVRASQTSIDALTARLAEKDEAGKIKFSAAGEPVWTDPSGAAELEAIQQTEIEIALTQFPMALLEKENLPWGIKAALLPMCEDLPGADLKPGIKKASGDKPPAKPSRNPHRRA